MSVFQLHNVNFHALRATSLAGVMLVTLSACSAMNPLNWFSDDEVNPPAELQDFTREVSMQRAWSVNVGNGQGNAYNKITPALDGSTLYAASVNGNVVAVNADNGDIIWRTRIDGTITGGVGARNGLVMIGTEEAEVVVLEQSSGEIRWRQPVSSEVLSAPQTNGDIVVAQTVDDKLVALEYSDGTQRWIYETTQPALTLRGTNRPVITSVGTVIAGFSNGTMVSVAAEDGIWRWEERIAIPEGRYDIERVIDVDGQLLLDGNRILASSYQGNLMALDIMSGRIVWGMEASSYNGLARGFGNLYYSSDDSHVVAVRDNSEDIAWQNSDLEYRELTAPTAINNYIAIADFEGYVHLLSQIDGRMVGRTRVDNDGVRAPMIVRAGMLYVFGNSGRLVALRLQQQS